VTLEEKYEFVTPGSASQCSIK